MSPVRLPRLLGVVVMAFAPYDVRPLLGAVELFRGMAIQLAYRWATGQVVADPTGRAVLLWSVPFRAGARRSLCRQLLGVMAATSVGIAMVIVCNGIVLLPLGIALMAAGVSANVVTVVGLSAVAAGLIMTCWRGVLAYRNERALTAGLPSPSGLRWRIDCLAAIPTRSGHGGRLLEEFLLDADACDAEVVLHCNRRNVAFYRRHGFHVAAPACSNGQRLMLRKASTRFRMRQEREHVRRATADAGTPTMPAAKRSQRSSGRIAKSEYRARPFDRDDGHVTTAPSAEGR